MDKENNFNVYEQDVFLVNPLPRVQTGFNKVILLPDLVDEGQSWSIQHQIQNPTRELVTKSNRNVTCLLNLVLTDLRRYMISHLGKCQIIFIVGAMYMQRLEVKEHLSSLHQMCVSRGSGG